jgi:hypothetical protein
MTIVLYRAAVGQDWEITPFAYPSNALQLYTARKERMRAEGWTITEVTPLCAIGTKGNQPPQILCLQEEE